MHFEVPFDMGFEGGLKHPESLFRHQIGNILVLTINQRSLKELSHTFGHYVVKLRFDSFRLLRAASSVFRWCSRPPTAIPDARGRSWSKRRDRSNNSPYF